MVVVEDGEGSGREGRNVGGGEYWRWRLRWRNGMEVELERRHGCVVEEKRMVMIGFVLVWRK